MTSIVPPATLILVELFSATLSAAESTTLCDGAEAKPSGSPKSEAAL